MARPPVAKQETLRSFTKTGECRIDDLTAAIGGGRKFAARRIHRFMSEGLIYRANHGQYPAVYKLTTKGAEEVSFYPPPMEIKPTEMEALETGIVAQAVKTQPKSIFDYANRV